MSERLERAVSTVSEESRLAWMALTLTPGMGATRVRRAMERIRARADAAALFSLPLTELEACGLPAASAQFVYEGKAREAAVAEVEKITAAGGSYLTQECAEYPQRLLEIYDPPTVLWLRGNAAALNQPGLAVVGTRHPTPYGTAMAQLLVRDLALRGLVILSGMARGIDSAAHKAALEAHGRTVAVWGTGIDVIYPKENKKLAEEILGHGGAILSEFAMGTFPAPQNFPVRNRVLSGMSVGVLVVEAGEYSGTRITARCALEQNRDVFAVPGNVTSKGAWVPNSLIKQGAKLTATWEDVWEELPTEVRLQLEELLGEKTETQGLLPGLESGCEGGASILTGEEKLPDEQRLVLGELRADEATQLDELIERLDGKTSSSEIFTALFELEMAGRVRQLPGKNYVRTL